MATFKVISAKVAGVEAGKTVNEADLPEGTNIDALIAAGHLAPIAKVQEAKIPEVKKADKE